jgi:hypothetical protein
MKKHGAKATEKLKADLARARLERLARPKRPKKAPAPDADSPSEIIRSFFDSKQ